MEKFNLAFFSLYENVFKVYSKSHGTTEALNFLKKLFAEGLSKAYSAVGFSKGNIHDFAKVVKERDESVGLPVELPLVTPEKIIYQFHRDPFPNLKNLVPARDLDNTYIDFKVKLLLGDNWEYTTTQHIWGGSPLTEHVISPKK